MLRTKFFFKNCLIFYWQIVFWPLVYSIKTAKTRHGKIRQFLKKNLVRNIFYPWHHKSPEKCHIELVESKMAERFFFLVSVDHSAYLYAYFTYGVTYLHIHSMLYYIKDLNCIFLGKGHRRRCEEAQQWWLYYSTHDPNCSKDAKKTWLLCIILKRTYKL